MLPEILGVRREEGGVCWVPLTPVTTFRDVAACVRDTGDPLPYLLEASPLGVRVVAGWERPLELLRLWNTLKDQVSYTAAYSLKDDPGDPLASLSKSSYLDEEEDEVKDPINPWELYDLKDELKDLGSELRHPLKKGSDADFYVSSRYNSDDPPLSRSLDDSDELMAVSSDGEGESPYAGHKRSPADLLARSLFDRNGLTRHNRSVRQPRATWNPAVAGERLGSSFVRGRPKTTSLPLKSQEVSQAPLLRPKERQPTDYHSYRCGGEGEHRKRYLPGRTIENGSLSHCNGHPYKCNDAQDPPAGVVAGKESYRERIKRNKNLSPVIRKKQKYRSTENKQCAKSGHKGRNGGKECRGGATHAHPVSPSAGHPHTNPSDIRRLLQEHFNSKASRTDPVGGGQRENHSPGAHVSSRPREASSAAPGGPDAQTRGVPSSVLDQDGGPKSSSVAKPRACGGGQRTGASGRPRQHQRGGGARTSVRQARDPRVPPAATDAPESHLLRPQRGGGGREGRQQALHTSADRPSRRTAAGHRTVHRRSYSDPLYEYLKEDSRTYTLRQPARQRRHSGGSALGGDVGMREVHTPLTLLPDGCELTVGELRDMASRQQQQIESQQQLLVAREQRLKYLKQQESRAAAVAAEAERLRRLRERVEAQEAKLRRLRALRGQVEATRLSTATLTTDLDAMRHLFSEKEKELVLAVSKVEELTRQLEELRQGRSPLNPNNQHHNELDKLRRELLYRNSVNREASARVAAQRETLAARREEINRIDKRVSELQQRLHRKRLLNHQLASQITAATQAKQAQLKAVQQKVLREGVHSESSIDDAHTPDHLKIPRGEDLGEFGPNKNDPKYQTLPYNTKFSVTFKSKNGQGGDSDSAPSTPTSTIPPSALSEAQVSSGQTPATPSSPPLITTTSGPPNTTASSGPLSTTATTSGPVTTTSTIGLANTTATSSAPNTGPVNGAVVTRTVHSIPTHPPSRGHAHAPALSQSQLPQVPQLSQQQQSSGPLKPTPNPAMTPRVYGPSAQQFSQRVQPLGGTALGQNQKLSPGVMTHTQNRTLLLSSHHPQDVENLRALGSNTGGEGSEDGTSSSDSNRNKPALPPKPAVPSKPLPPPRQKGDPLAASNESLNTSMSTGRGGNQGRSPQGYRYASQNVIMSTYTQQQATGADNQPGDGSEDNARTKVVNNSLNNSVNNNSASAKSDPDGGEKVHVSINRRIEMPPDFMFPEDETPPSDLLGRRVEEIENGSADSQVSSNKENVTDSVDCANILPLSELEKLRIDRSKEDKSSQEDSNCTTSITHVPSDDSRQPDGADTTSVLSEEGRSAESEVERSSTSTISATVSTSAISNNNNNNNNNSNINNINNNNNNNNNNNSSGGGVVVRRIKKGNLKTKNSSRVPRRVSFDPLALLLDASLEGELELVRRTAMEVTNPSAANDEGITALHNAICAGHLDIVTFLVTFGCDVNAQDSDGWTPLHCAASCNNVAMVRFLVEHGACILATTLSDHETAAEKCEQDEEGYDGCSQYLYSVQEKLGIMNGGVVYAVYEYESQASDELSFHCSDAITVLRRGDEYEREWWWGQLQDVQGYIPRNLLGLYPRVKNPLRDS